MKYRDLITLFLGLAALLSLGYALGVDHSVWYLPVILFVLLGVTVYKMWIQ
jgi:hypothetical protein